MRHIVYVEAGGIIFGTLDFFQVHCWLEKVFGGDGVPHYEVNHRTTELLYNLKQLNEKQDKAADIITEDLQQKAEEYEVEGLSHCT